VFCAESGRVFATGLNDFGQLGIGSSVTHTLVSFLDLPSLMRMLLHCLLTELWLYPPNSSGKNDLGDKLGGNYKS
jgi:hypothetical protein